jgi:hypothetical protein
MPATISIGIDVTERGAIALAVDVRTGRIAVTASGNDASNVYKKIIADAQGRNDQIIGVGLSRELSPFTSTPPIICAKSRAHACVPGAGVASPSTMVLVFDDGACRLLMNSRTEARPAGVSMIPDSILPGYFGYVLDPIPMPTAEADAMLRFALAVRAACELLRDAGVQVRRFVATKVPGESGELMQILADVLDGRIKIAASDQPAALGAAVLAAIAAGLDRTGHASLSQTIHAMAHQRRDLIYRPDVRTRNQHEVAIAKYLADRRE